jgi:hypothetical protein
VTQVLVRRTRELTAWFGAAPALHDGLQNWVFNSQSREGQQFSTATPLTSTQLPCLRLPRSVLRHAWTTAMPRVRNEVRNTAQGISECVEAIRRTGA